MTSSIFLPRRSLAWPEPRTHFTESTMFVLPEPLGPTMAVTPPSKVISVCRAKVLKPSNCRDLRNKSVRGGYQIGTVAPKRHSVPKLGRLGRCEAAARHTGPRNSLALYSIGSPN